MSRLILSLDGGGIRGAATTQFLYHVEEKLNNDHGISIRDCIDFYAGTSTGSIIALGLATTNLSVKDINQLFSYQNAKIIFTRNRWWLELDGINAPKYEAKGKTKLLKTNFGNAKIRDVPDGKHVLAVTYAIEKRKPEVIKSSDSKYRDLDSYKVADASTAAPTYFPTREVEIGASDEEYWLIDGGVTANNPTMCAIAEAKSIWSDLSLENLRVLSVGTGYRTRKINGPESTKWGAISWLVKGQILDVLTDERVVAYQAITILKPGSYIRVNSEMRPQPGLSQPPDDAMDDISKTNINRLKEMGSFWFEQYGNSVINLLLNQYHGESLDRIDEESGQPIIYKQ
ncbi:patatin [Microbulbifer sp. A4B17]|uniref:patatin-like phospholipase family protein n=1 Tax=Microbulbifer sp. A4B17 TaxID=359370 RepID=UPI000D52B541|nr:patatin-like phospholipase family protein [Microbulbifer sp. A4B17]AWF80554.1 patatin [Microbulbifer sp. A4B17]